MLRGEGIELVPPGRASGCRSRTRGFTDGSALKKKELWGFRENRMAVRFEYEWHDTDGRWFRSYGNELWEFADNGLMRRRYASINDAPIREEERRIA